MKESYKDPSYRKQSLFEFLHVFFLSDFTVIPNDLMS